MNYSKVSDKFPKLFVDQLDDMLTDSTSMGEVDFIDDLLDLVNERLVSLHTYYKDSLDSVEFYQREIMERKVNVGMRKDRYAQVAKFLDDETHCSLDNC